MHEVTIAVARGAIVGTHDRLPEASLLLAIGHLPSGQAVELPASWPFDLLPTASPATLQQDFERTRLRALDEQEETTVKALEDYLRHAFLSGIGLLVLSGTRLPYRALTTVSKFSTRLACLGVVNPPRTRDERESVSLQMDTYGEANEQPMAFLLSPTASLLSPVSQSLNLQDTVTQQSSGRSQKTPVSLHASFNTDATLASLRVGECVVPYTIPGRSSITEDSPVILLYSVEPTGSSITPEGTVRILYADLDQASGPMLQDIAGLTRASSDSPSLSHQLEDRYSSAALTSREKALLKDAMDELALLGRVSRGTALSFALPDFIEPSAGIQYRSLDAIQKKLQTAIDVASIEGPGSSELKNKLDTMWKTADKLRVSLAPGVPPPILRVEDRMSLNATESRFPLTQHLFYGKITKLGELDHAQLKAFFQRQRSALSVLNRYDKYDIELRYRIYTAKRASRILTPIFEVEATVSDVDTATAEKLRIGVGEVFHTMLLGTYGISFSLRGPFSGAEDERLSHARYRKFIVPTDNGSQDPPQRLGFPDWAMVLDYFLTQDDPCALEISVKAGGHLNSLETGMVSAPMMPIASVGESWDKTVLEAQLLSEDLGRDAVRLSIAVAADQPVSDSLVKTVAAEVTNQGDYCVVDDPQDQLLARQIYPIPRVLTVFHPPLGGWFETALGAADLDIPSPVDSFPVGGVALGVANTWHAKATRAVTVRVPDRDRLRHLYIVGRTGSGKTNLLRGMVSAELESPSNGLAVIDPHGDLAEHLKNSAPKARTPDIRLIDLSDATHVPILNPLLLRERTPETRAVVSQGVLALLQKRTYHTFTGPRFEQLFGLVLDTMLDDGYPYVPSLVECSLILGNGKVQRWLRRQLKSDELQERWEQHDSQKRSNDYGDLIQWATSKFDDFARDPVLRCVLGGERNTVDIEQVVASNGILVVSLPESKLGQKTAEFIGSLVLLQLKNALIGRDTQDLKGDFFLYVDEFQKFAFQGFEDLLAEGRKFRAGVVIAHQNLDQLRSFSEYTGTHQTSLYSSIFGNVGGVVSFGVGAPDAEVLSRVFEVPRSDFQRIGRFEALAKLTIGDRLYRSFSLRVPHTRPSLNPRTADHIRQHLIDEGSILSRVDVLATVSKRQDSLVAGERRAAEAEKKKRFAEIQKQSQTSAASVRAAHPTVGLDAEATAALAPTPPESPATHSGTSFIDQWFAKRQQSHNSQQVASEPDSSRSATPRPPEVDDSNMPPVLAEGNHISDAAWWSLLGPVVRLERVAAKWDVSEDELRTRGERRELVILRTSDGVDYVPRSHLLLDRVKPNVREILSHFRGKRLSPWSIAGWLATPNDGLGGASPLSWLDKGDSKDILSAIVTVFAEGAD